jgi:hypothetical protein
MPVKLPLLVVPEPSAEVSFRVASGRPVGFLFLLKRNAIGEEDQASRSIGWQYHRSLCANRTSSSRTRGATAREDVGASRAASTKSGVRVRNVRLRKTDDRPCRSCVPAKCSGATSGIERCVHEVVSRLGINDGRGRHVLQGLGWAGRTAWTSWFTNLI